ncbi:MAG: primosomal protein N' [Chlamydiae bacterium]|nr:primosomal protein N' [Chlamydiota bacterium]
MSESARNSVATVVLDTGIDKPLDYQIPDELAHQISLGSRVLVPIQKRFCPGIVINLHQNSAFAKIKPVEKVITSSPLISPDLFLLGRWISAYYCAPLSKVLPLFLPPGTKNEIQTKTQHFVKPLVSLEALREETAKLRGKCPKQAEVLDYFLKNPKGILAAELLQKIGPLQSSLKTLIKKKLLDCSEIEVDRSLILEHEYFPTKPKTLTPEQKETFAKITKSLDEEKFETHLIYGVTGSGKTEIYLQAIEYCLQKQKQAILLVPEIALTSQTIEKLKGRFESRIAIMHHRLSLGERFDSWHKIAKGEIPIVVGARSAIFSPLPNLGLIIIDEEHDSSYKQNEKQPCYHARDVAVMRGKLTKSTVVLASATPSLESYQNALSKKYVLSTLKTRTNQASLPTISIVNMQSEFEKNKGFTLFSNKLLQGIKKRLEIGEQSLLFLNRRGYYSVKQCSRCSHSIDCPHCDVSLTFHLSSNTLSCHLCDYTIPSPRICPSCGALDEFTHKGVGTEQVEKTLHAIFPGVRTLRLDRDTTKQKGSHEIFFKQFRSGKADVLIGTQMIAKGLHFPSVTLVGILQIDTALHIPDFRASEIAFSHITQVAGRAGRADLLGEVIIQTSLPENTTIKQGSTQDYEQFFTEEIATRKFFAYPPFTHMVKIVCSGSNAEKAEDYLKRLRTSLIQRVPASFHIHPIVPCGHAKVKDKHRFQFLIKAEKLGNLSAIIQDLLTSFPVKKDLHLLIDVDPSSTFF